MPEVEIIAEIAQAHDGSLGILHSYIDALSETGVNTVKFQMHIAEAESSVFEPFRVKFSREDNTRYDYWKRMGFTLEQWQGIKEHCEENGLEFLCSPFSVKAVEWMEQLGVERYKIASGEITNYLMLERICKTGKPMLLSSGMSSFKELDETIEFINTHKGSVSAVFQCTTSYPTPPEQLGLNVITEMHSKYKLPVGLSDHSGEIYASIAATALGVDMIEFHAVFDKQMFGPDTKSSLTISQISEAVKGIRFVESARKTKVDKDNTSAYSALKTMFGKSLAVNRDLPAGHVIAISDLESKKPGNKGLPASQYESVVGKTLLKAIAENEFLTEDYF